MVHLYCDACGKEVRKPIRGGNYVAVLGKDLCLPCRDELIRQTGKEMLRRDQYQLKAYNVVYEQTLRRMCK